jgi:PIF1-like helicase
LSCSQIINTEETGRDNELLRRQFRRPKPVNTNVAQKWKDLIDQEVKMEKIRRLQNETMSSGRQYNGENNYMGTQPQWFESVQRTVCEDDQLNDAQQRAFNLFIKPLKLSMGEEVAARIRERSPGWDRQMLYLGGAGGTGKTRVIHAIKALLERTDCRNQLLVSATTGTAAKLIAGSTIDSLCGFGRGNRTNTADIDDDDDYYYGDSRFQRTDMDNSWTNCRFLILDEVSIGGCGKLARISEALCERKSDVLPFGGLSVLFSGDFHQLPPVMDVPLYVNPSSRKMPSLASNTRQRVNDEQNGYNLFQDITKTKVLLKEHYRARDEAVYSVLDRIRCGNATTTDKQLLHSRTFGCPGGPDVEDKEWRTAMLITTRNDIREAWSNVSSLRHAVDNGTQIFISPSIDEGIDCNRRKMVWRAADSKMGFLPTWNVLCVDAPTIVKTNTAVELGTANGTKGIIREVVPDPEDGNYWLESDRKSGCQVDEASNLRNGGTGERQAPPGEYWRAGWHIPNDADTREISVPRRFWRKIKTHVAYSAITDVRICFIGSYSSHFKMKVNVRSKEMG